MAYASRPHGDSILQLNSQPIEFPIFKPCLPDRNPSTPSTPASHVAAIKMPHWQLRLKVKLSLPVTAHHAGIDRIDQRSMPRRHKSTQSRTTYLGGIQCHDRTSVQHSHRRWKSRKRDYTSLHDRLAQVTGSLHHTGTVQLVGRR
jgi:hypothetical protein